MRTRGFQTPLHPIFPIRGIRSDLFIKNRGIPRKKDTLS